MLERYLLRLLVFSVYTWKRVSRACIIGSFCILYIALQQRSARHWLQVGITNVLNTVGSWVVWLLLERWNTHVHSDIEKYYYLYYSYSARVSKDCERICIANMRDIHFDVIMFFVCIYLYRLYVLCTKNQASTLRAILRGTLLFAIHTVELRGAWPLNQRNLPCKWPRMLFRSICEFRQMFIYEEKIPTDRQQCISHICYQHNIAYI